MSGLKKSFCKKKCLEQLQKGESLAQRRFIEACCNECNKCGKRSKCNKCKEIFELECGGQNGKKLRLDTLPLYCFCINNPTKKARRKGHFWVDTLSTKQYFKAYYILVGILLFLVMVYMMYMWCSSWHTTKEELSGYYHVDVSDGEQRIEITSSQWLDTDTGFVVTIGERDSQM